MSSNGLISEVEALRADYSREEDKHSARTLQSLARKISRSSVLSREPIADAVLKDLSAVVERPFMGATKEHINRRIDNKIFSVFSAAYFPTLSVDYMEYDLIASDDVLAERYPSPTMPVNMLAHSEGFEDRVVVALFPENHIDGNQSPDDLIFYFINKFVSRHRLTRRLISAAMVPGSFSLLDGAGDDAVERAAASWVRLHEYHHRTGNMPIPQFLKAKSYKPLAGLEEMRVDVKSMLVCLDDGNLNQELARLTYEFILAERLLRYSVEGIPRPNYDAISSQLLFNYLRSHGALVVERDRIRLAPELPDALRALIHEITALEDVVLVEGEEPARQGLIEFTRAYTRYDPETRQFLHIPLFAELKARLKV